MLLLPDNVTGTTAMHALCADETCTYSRTGTGSACQDCYECITCNMAGRYCVCIACAKTCHVGHDIRYKGFISAFCDCVEKGTCQRPPPVGQDSEREDLITMLLLLMPQAEPRTAEGLTPLHVLVGQTVQLARIPIVPSSGHAKACYDDDQERSKARSCVHPSS